VKQGHQRGWRDDRGVAKTSTMAVWLVILAVVVALGADIYSVVGTRVHTENDAQAAALAASQAYLTNHDNLPDAYAAATAALAGKGDTVLTSGFTVTPNGAISLVVQHSVHTLLLGRLDKKLGVATENGDATFTPSG
jgi:hypothetical protein